MCHRLAIYANDHCNLGMGKEIRNAVEAAHKAISWAKMSGHARGQVLCYFAEKLEARAEAFIAHVQAIDGISVLLARQPFEQVLERVFFYAAMADKYV